MTRLRPLVLLAVLAPAVAVAVAVSPADTIAARQAGFKKMGGAMKAINEQLKTDAPARDVIAAAAHTIAATAHEQGALFPAGTGPDSGVKTEALPVIWTDRATFDADMARMVDAAARLVAATDGGDPAAIGAEFKATGATCAACHHAFRAES